MVGSVKYECVRFYLTVDLVKRNQRTGGRPGHVAVESTRVRRLAGETNESRRHASLAARAQCTSHFSPHHMRAVMRKLLPPLLATILFCFAGAAHATKTDDTANLSGANDQVRIDQT